MSATELGDDFFKGSFTVTATDVYAVRSFTIEQDGWLTGVTYKQRWGVTATAECHVGAERDERPDWAVSYYWVNHAAGVTSKPGHAPGSQGCTCGFYAYWSGDDKWGADYRASAVIAAWGVMTAGSKGLRCQHARIVALVKPREPWTEQDYVMGEPSLRHHQGVTSLTWQRVVERYPGVPVFASLDAALAEFPPTPLRQAS